MVLVAHHDPEEFTMNYPEPPQAVYTAALEMGLSPESYHSYPRGTYDAYATTMAFDANGAPIYDAPYMQNGRSSPGLYQDDDLRVPSSNMSTASASSSTMGSPLSNPGQLATMPDWAAPHTLGGSPSIVDQPDCYPSSVEYAFHPNPAFEFQSKAPGFVGEFSSEIPRSHHLSSPTRPRHATHGSISSTVSCESSSTIIPGSSASSGLALDTRLAQASSIAAASPVSTSASTTSSSLVFASPSVSSTSSFSSPPPPAWSSPVIEEMSPTARPKPVRLVSPFFSQSSGHFVPPLETSYPSLIHPDVNVNVRSVMPPYESTYPPPNAAYPASPALSASPQLRTGSTSPFLHNSNYQQFSPFPVPVDAQGRRPSLVYSNFSGEQPFSGDEGKEKQRCPHPDCGKTFKDLKAHMLTHQTERPEKCPIASCDYHIKGFARKYDKNRHTLTHYKGTMVCGFCPGSGSATEKSFNRADVFKRHLTAVHGVEQTPPNSRKKTGGANTGVNTGKKLTGYAPDATGKCSTCSQTFSNAQDFYEHLDDCVLRIVQQEDPAEAINAKRLAEVENDREVHTTLERNNLPTTTMTSNVEEDEDDDMIDDEADYAEEDAKRGVKTSPTKKPKGNPVNGVQKSRGMTHSRGGVPLAGKNRRKNRQNYPGSWGFDKGQMTMKKRVMTVFDGSRRLAKDDMMLSTEHEVRVKLPDGKSYVTDLDVQTLKRAEGFLGATDEEKGPWISDDPTEEELRSMLECRA